MRLDLPLRTLVLAAFSLWSAVAAANTPPPCGRASCKSQIVIRINPKQYEILSDIEFESSK